MTGAAVTLAALGTTLVLLGCGAPEAPATGPTPTPTPEPGTGAVARVVFVADSFAVTQGGSAQASAIAVDAAGQPVSDATIAYSIVGLGTAVASVTTGGSVSGVKPGVTGIRASV